MAAAVADYRPKVDPQFFGGKFRRKNENLTLELEPTPDLLAEVAKSRRPNQLMVGFALEPRDELLASAHAKLQRKKIDMVVANPLETMDSDTIEAIVLSKNAANPTEPPRETRTPGLLTKPQAAAWIMDQIQGALGH
jgi:phosphopantothenoylcysteine decarboxylase/phosphopantothenate--cysteine ligase